MNNGISPTELEDRKRIAEKLRELANELESPTSTIIGVTVTNPSPGASSIDEWQLTITKVKPRDPALDKLRAGLTQAVREFDRDCR